MEEVVDDSSENRLWSERLVGGGGSSEKCITPAVALEPMVSQRLDSESETDEEDAWHCMDRKYAPLVNSSAAVGGESIERKFTTRIGRVT